MASCGSRPGFGGVGAGSAPRVEGEALPCLGESVPLEMACADCDCVVEDGVRVETCQDANCCCAHIPEAEA